MGFPTLAFNASQLTAGFHSESGEVIDESVTTRADASTTRAAWLGRAGYGSEGTMIIVPEPPRGI